MEAAANGHVTLYTSPVLVAELRSTLSYARLAKYVQRSGLTLDELLTRYLNVAIVVEPETVPQVVRDPDDDQPGEDLAELFANLRLPGDAQRSFLQQVQHAHAAQTDLIATGDNDLLDLKAYRNISIVTPAEALRRVEAQK